ARAPAGAARARQALQGGPRAARRDRARAVGGQAVTRSGRLTVAIDVSAGLQQGAGVGRYVRELVRALAALPDGPSLLPFATRAPDRANGSSPLAFDAVRRLALGNRGWRLAALASLSTRVPLAGALPRADVVHGTDI